MVVHGVRVRGVRVRGVRAVRVRVLQLARHRLVRRLQGCRAPPLLHLQINIICYLKYR